MSRRTPALVAVAALTTVSALGAASAGAATQHHRPVPRAARQSSVRIEGRGASKAAGSVALVGTADGNFQAVKGVTGTQVRKSGLFDLPADSYATAVNPVRGKDGLLCTSAPHIYPVKGLRATPHFRSGTGIHGSRYAGEGGPTYGFFCYGVAMHGSVALAAGDSQGLLQLIRKKGEWKIDKRVQFPGLNDLAQPHLPGWIDFRDSVTQATLFSSVAIAPRPMPNGKVLAVAVDRVDATVVVVSGVGTARPRVLGALSAKALSNNTTAQGTGGLAFLPSSPDRAVIATASGFAVLNLHKPSEPRLKVRTTVGDGSVAPSSITVSSDSDHLAIAVGGRVHGYKNVLGATKGEHFKKQTSFAFNAAEEVRDVAYTANDTLVALHGDPLNATGWFLTLVKKVTGGHHVVRGSILTTEPNQDLAGSLSLWPAP
jgi:hypothetical protein